MKIDFPIFLNRATELKISPQGYFCMPDRSKTVPAAPEPKNTSKHRLFEKRSKNSKNWPAGGNYEPHDN